MDYDLGRAHKYIQYVDNEFGGRLKFYGEKASEEFWDSVWSETRSPDYRRQMKGHLSFALTKAFLGRLDPGSRVLEAGSGLGHFTVAMHARGFDAKGVDFAPEVVEMMRSQFPDLDFRVGDVTKLNEFSDGTFDAIYSPGVCEHFEGGPAPVFTEAYRLLAPGGIFVNSSPSFNWLRKQRARLGAFQREEPVDMPFYQWVYSSEEMVALMEESGFQVEAIIGKGCIISLEECLPRSLRIPFVPLRRLIAGGLDHTPLSRLLGHSHLWVARKPA